MAQATARIRPYQLPFADRQPDAGLILHTGAYWLMLTMRDAISNAHSLVKAELATIRLRLLKLGARVIETVSRVRLAFAAACSDAGLIAQLATTIVPAAP